MKRISHNVSKRCAANSKLQSMFVLHSTGASGPHLFPFLRFSVGICLISFLIDRNLSADVLAIHFARDDFKLLFIHVCTPKMDWPRSGQYVDDVCTPATIFCVCMALKILMFPIAYYGYRFFFVVFYVVFLQSFFATSAKLIAFHRWWGLVIIYKCILVCVGHRIYTILSKHLIRTHFPPRIPIDYINALSPFTRLPFRPAFTSVCPRTHCLLYIHAAICIFCTLHIYIARNVNFPKCMRMQIELACNIWSMIVHYNQTRACAG